MPFHLRCVKPCCERCSTQRVHASRIAMFQSCNKIDFMRLRPIRTVSMHGDGAILTGAFPQSAKAGGAAGWSAYMMREFHAFDLRVAHLCEAAARLVYESLGVISCCGEASRCRAKCKTPCAAAPACTWHSHCNKRVTANVLLPVSQGIRGRSEGKAGTTGSNRTTSWTRPGNANASYEAAAGP